DMIRLRDSELADNRVVGRIAHVVVRAGFDAAAVDDKSSSRHAQAPPALEGKEAHGAAPVLARNATPIGHERKPTGSRPADVLWLTGKRLLEAAVEIRDVVETRRKGD